MSNIYRLKTKFVGDDAHIVPLAFFEIKNAFSVRRKKILTIIGNCYKIANMCEPKKVRKDENYG